MNKPFAKIVAFAAGVTLVLCGVARADKIKHPTAVFAGLDKITGRIISFDVATDETVQFGSLQITPRVCYTRPPTETPQTDGFVEVDEVETDNKFRRIFSGWMFASSPGLHGVEHPVYDVWLTDCKGGSQVISETAALPPEEVAPATPQPPTAKTPAPRRQAPPRANTAANPNLPPPGPLDPPRARPTAAAPGPDRRSPTQSFFPTASNPGDSARERDLMR